MPDTTERRVLVVCTANVCRSPVAERALQREWDRQRRAGRRAIRRHRRRPARVHRYTVEAAHFTHIDLSDHRSRRLDAALIATDGADLVLGMTRQHLRAAIDLDPSCWPRAFTFRELARRTADAARATRRLVGNWLTACAWGRDPQTLLIPDLLDDLPDAYGQPGQPPTS